MASGPPKTSFRGAYAKSILGKHLLHKYNQRRNQKDDEHAGLPKAPPFPPGFAQQEPYAGRICIVGAGACGLYLAMMLRFLGFEHVDILEATDRVGGRCYTQQLPGEKPEDVNANHNYYDVGAMRIPDIPWMQQ